MFEEKGELVQGLDDPAKFWLGQRERVDPHDFKRGDPCILRVKMPAGARPYALELHLIFVALDASIEESNGVVMVMCEWTPDSNDRLLLLFDRNGDKVRHVPPGLEGAGYFVGGERNWDGGLAELDEDLGVPAEPVRLRELVGARA